MIKLLVVDDSALARKLLGALFKREADFDLRFARDGREALDLLQSFGPDVVTLDVHMPGMDGLACLDHIMLDRPCPVVMVSSLTEAGAEATLEALRLGAVDFIPKPGGALSLEIEEIAALLVTKVRAAASARLRPTLRLRERISRAAETSRHETLPQPLALKESPASTSVEGLVLVGVSTGGPPALETFLSALPSSFRWPILIAQHMPATFTGPLARRLDKLSPLHVQEVREPAPLHPGGVYIGRGDADLTVGRRPSGLVAMASPARADYPWHPSADRLVRSAMQQVATKPLIGVLMTGMGSDGAEAMALLRAQGGRTIAESKETAVIWGMPGELVRAGGADWVLPVGAIASHLQRMTA